MVRSPYEPKRPVRRANRPQRARSDGYTGSDELSDAGGSGGEDAPPPVAAALGMLGRLSPLVWKTSQAPYPTAAARMIPT